MSMVGAARGLGRLATNRVAPSVWNLGSGLELKSGANWAIGLGLTTAGALGAVSDVKLAHANQYQRGIGADYARRTQGTTTSVGSIPAYRYGNPPTGYDLGATGDLVLALNRNR